MDLKTIRPAYNDKNDGFTDEAVASWSCPFDLFGDWISLATNALEEPNAMTIATVDSNGRPAARVVLLKEFSKEKGFVFFTNYEGRKAQEIAGNSNVALVFYWAEIHKQIRIEGKAKKVPTAESKEYFQSRSKASQAGSAASPQSKIVESREWLWQRNEELLAKDEIPMPNWGGYSVEPDWIEFWQGQSNRLHDRIVFSKRGFPEATTFTNKLENGWQKARLAP